MLEPIAIEPLLELTASWPIAIEFRPDAREAFPIETEFTVELADLPIATLYSPEAFAPCPTAVAS